MTLIEQVASDQILEEALVWLRRRRRDYSHHSDVWFVIERWAETKPMLQGALRAGTFRFSPLRRVHTSEGDLDLWAALDALVLKALAIVLTDHLAPRLSAHCHHLAGNGGAKAAVRHVRENLAQNQFVFRTDVKSYYASIDHQVLFAQLQRHVDDPRLLDLLWQYLRRTVYDDGIYRDIKHGISLGCPLSPLMGALFLDDLDRAVERTGLCYARFMDDWVILAPTRWKLRKAVAIVNQTLGQLKVEKHPDKTFIGRIERGFDFLGYRITPKELAAAEKTCEKAAARVTQLYEQGATIQRIEGFVRRWRAWLKGGGCDDVMLPLDAQGSCQLKSAYATVVQRALAAYSVA